MSHVCQIQSKKSTPERVDFFIPLPTLKLPDFY